jgi:hypothetical protein
MKSSIIITMATLLSIGACLPTTNQAITARQSPTWSFSVYQGNARCTGARDPYSGSGTTECTKGIRNGSFGSYIPGDIRNDCSVYLYANEDCDPAGLIDIMTAADEKTCLQPLLETTNSASFRTSCREA